MEIDTYSYVLALHPLKHPVPALIDNRHLFPIIDGKRVQISSELPRGTFDPFRPSSRYKGYAFSVYFFEFVLYGDLGGASLPRLTILDVWSQAEEAGRLVEGQIASDLFTFIGSPVPPTEDESPTKNEPATKGEPVANGVPVIKDEPPVRDELPVKGELPVKDEPPIKDELPVKDEPVIKDELSTKDETATRDISPAKDEPPAKDS